ncbi:MAG TPA: hypothetical protein VJT54_16015, partial [Verrucomicrobiae bacterium]|nr:hypothetical protein [Verrucomicrobiae bacterium]
LKAVLPPVLLGVFLNPDEIEAEIRRQGLLERKTSLQRPFTTWFASNQSCNRLDKILCKT